MREIITQRLAAVHVEVADMSGEFLPSSPGHKTLTPTIRRSKHTAQPSQPLLSLQPNLLS